MDLTTFRIFEAAKRHLLADDLDRCIEQLSVAAARDLSGEDRTTVLGELKVAAQLQGLPSVALAVHNELGEEMPSTAWAEACLNYYTKTRDMRRTLMQLDDFPDSYLELVDNGRCSLLTRALEHADLDGADRLVSEKYERELTPDEVSRIFAGAMAAGNYDVTNRSAKKLGRTLTQYDAAQLLERATKHGRREDMNAILIHHF